MKGKKHEKIKTTTLKKKQQKFDKNIKNQTMNIKNKKQMINKEKFLNRQKTIQNGVTNKKRVKNEQI
jgi:hypothetical protein